MRISRRHQRSFSFGRFLAKTFFLIALCGSIAAFFLFFERSAPTIDLTAIKPFIGTKEDIVFSVSDTGSGIRKIVVHASQGTTQKEVFSFENPRTTYTGQIGPAQLTKGFEFDAGGLGFKEGAITLSVTAYDFSFMGMLQGNSTTESASTTLDTGPPVISILHSEQYISPGGSGIAIYTVDDSKSKHGAVINGHYNPGHPIDSGRPNTYITYFTMPYDATELSEAIIKATDMAGNSSHVPFSPVVKMIQQKHDRINISDGFLSTKIPEFKQHYPEMSGTLVDQYLYTNSDVRTANNSKISEITSKSSSTRLWQGRFQRMPGSNRANFADHRTYYYKGEAIDKQVHLGMDIASTSQADVNAANGGTIVFADYLGIYGKLVIIDHGQGVFSLYSHLSNISAKVGDTVATNDLIGLTGKSGMAGGDHLHFSMLVNGVFATPIEWWDPHWIEVTIDKPLENIRSN